jgi:hypothetical protein
MKDSLYEIPPGCICMGDGLMGMRCDAPTHARLKHRPVTKTERKRKSSALAQPATASATSAQKAKGS